MTSSSHIDSLLSPARFNRDQLRAEMLGHKVLSLDHENIAAWAEHIHDRNVLIGVPDDRGVALNHGYPGASAGPDAFRNALYRLYDVRYDTGDWAGDSWIDIGDLRLQPSIAETHAALAEVVHLLLSHQARRVHVIGGGHDFSFGSYLGHARSCSGVLPLINFDAHFDLRAVDHGLINSGTAFRRVIESLDEHIAGGRALLEVGIQRERNPQSLWDYAHMHGVAVAEYTGASDPWMFHRMPGSSMCSLREHTTLWLEQWLSVADASGHVHLSIDLDVFQTSAALGTSASTCFGVPVERLWPCMEDVLSRNICRVVDVAELCPVRDVQSQTARLAAAAVFRGSISWDALSRELVRDQLLG